MSLNQLLPPLCTLELVKFFLLSMEEKFHLLIYTSLSKELELILINRKRHNQAGVKNSDKIPFGCTEGLSLLGCEVRTSTSHNKLLLP